MNQLALVFGGIFGFLAILFGAFGAHLLKKKLTKEQLQSFETGVKYQMYHALILLIIGFQIDVISLKFAIYGFILGTILFSFSIYGLVISSTIHKKLSFLGPITPIGGLILLASWAILTYKIITGF